MKEYILEYRNYITDIQYYFNYLIEEYGFIITKIVDKTDQMFIKVEYSSKSTIFTIRIWRDEISGIIRPIDEPEAASLSINLIYEYFTRNNILKNRSLFTKPRNNNIEKTLVLLEKLLKGYCKPFIRGDYSQWNKLLLWNYVIIKKEYHDITGKVLPDIAVKELAEYLRTKKMLK